MFDPDHNASPFNSIPPVVVVLALLIGGVELFFQAANAGLVGGSMGFLMRSTAWGNFAFRDEIFEWMLRNSTYPVEHLWRFVTYPFVHQAAMHAVMACVLLLAIGKFVGERFRSVHVLLIFFVSAVAGALAYGVILDDNRPLVGAYPAVYGLLGAFTWVLWIGANGDPVGRLQAFRLIGFLMGLQLLFQALFGGGFEWVADLSGFVAGFGLCFLLAPGALRTFLDRSRNR